jgi:predicted amidophosphoribosyltransferase
VQKNQNGLHHAQRAIHLSPFHSRKTIKHRYLLEWKANLMPPSNHENSEEGAEAFTETDLRHQIRLLKERGSKHDWNNIAKIFKREFDRCLLSDIENKDLKDRSLSRGLYFIPIPSARKKMHAHFFAMALSKLYSGVYWPCLVSKSLGEQKHKSLSERKAVRFEVALSDAPSFLHQTDFSQRSNLWVLVDDILTTGASASAATEAISLLGQALGLPIQRVEIWTLAYRAKIDRVH